MAVLFLSMTQVNKSIISTQFVFVIVFINLKKEKKSLLTMNSHLSVILYTCDNSAINTLCFFSRLAETVGTSFPSALLHLWFGYGVLCIWIL